MKQIKLSNLQIADFCRGMGLMIHSGVSLGDGLALLAEEEAGDVAFLVKEIGRSVDEGHSLTEAISATECFPNYVTGMVAAAELTGRLEETLVSLANYYEDQERMENQIRNTLLYPSILTILMLLVIGVLLVKVMPMFESAYEALGAGLTGMAGGLLLLGQGLKAVLPVLCMILGGAVVFLMAFGISRSVRDWGLNQWKRFRGDRGTARKINNSRFVHVLAMGLKSGVSAAEASQQAAEMVKDIPEANARAQQCAEGLNRGEDLADVLKNCQMLSPAAARLLALGIKGGNGDVTLEEIAARIREEAEQEMERTIGRIEPALVLTTSLLVGIILLAVMLPLMDIMSVIG